MGTLCPTIHPVTFLIISTMPPISPASTSLKEDFIWFVKKASTNKKSDAHAELYHCLFKMFVDADTNKDGLVSKASFSKLIDMAASIPRMYGYAPIDSELYIRSRRRSWPGRRCSTPWT